MDKCKCPKHLTKKQLKNNLSYKYDEITLDFLIYWKKVQTKKYVEKMHVSLINIPCKCLNCNHEFVDGITFQVLVWFKTEKDSKFNYKVRGTGKHLRDYRFVRNKFKNTRTWKNYINKKQ